MTAPVLLDASCLLAWAFAETGADRVEAGLTVVPMGWPQTYHIATVVALATAATDGGVE